MTEMIPATLASLAPAAALMLKQHPKMLAFGASGLLGFDDSGLWIFQSGPEEDKPYRDPQGTGTSAIVVGNTDTWGSNPHNTAQFPILQILIYSDCTRGPDNTPVKADQKTKAFKIYEAVDDLINDPANDKHVWMGRTILSCLRREGPSVSAVPDTNGLVRLMVRYEIALM